GANRAGAEAGTRPIGRGDVEWGPDNRGVGPPPPQLFGFRQKWAVPERHHSGVGQVELLGHTGRKVALVIMLVPHAMTVPLGGPGCSTVDWGTRCRRWARDRVAPRHEIRWRATPS